MWGKWKVGIGNSWHDMTEDIGVTQVARTCPGAAFFLSPQPQLPIAIFSIFRFGIRIESSKNISSNRLGLLMGPLIIK